jgi:hypothetical protein
MKADNRELEEHRKEFLEYIETVQPTEVPNKGRENRLLKPGQSYQPHETTEDSTNG